MEEKDNLLTEDQLDTYARVEVIAHLFGVTVRRVQQLTQEGIIASEKVSGYYGKLYNVAETIKAYITYLSGKVNTKAGKSDTEVALKNQKLRAEIALKESQGELHKLKTEIATGNYVSVEEIKLEYSKFFATFKKFALGIPGRLAGRLTGQIDPIEVRKLEQEMQGDITSQLNDFVISAIKPDE